MSENETRYTITPSVDSTLAIELYKTGWMRKKKHILYFENFDGELRYCAEQPEASEMKLAADAKSVVCRDVWLNGKKQRTVADFAKGEALSAATHPKIQFRSIRIVPKELRGFIVEGELKIRGISRMVKANVVMNPKKRGTLQIDGEVSICLSDFGIAPPSAMFGLIGTKDEGLVRVLLWAHPADGSAGQAQA